MISTPQQDFKTDVDKVIAAFKGLFQTLFHINMYPEEVNLQTVRLSAARGIDLIDTSSLVETVRPQITNITQALQLLDAEFERDSSDFRAKRVVIQQHSKDAMVSCQEAIEALHRLLK